MANGSVSGSTHHLSLLWRHFWLGSCYSRNTNKSIFIVIQIVYKFLTEFCSTHDKLQSTDDWATTAALQKRHLSLALLLIFVCVCAHKWVTVSILVCACVCEIMWIKCASVLERLMKSSPKVRCHAVSTAVVQDQSLTSDSPPWKPSRNPKEEDKGQPKRKYC